ncbi:MAG: hypothetical protein HQL41_11205 [Alphaproteobacteria bacterium]|nr:hypothetical protein [Alphaproteobacteria bacterium]
MSQSSTILAARAPAKRPAKSRLAASVEPADKDALLSMDVEGQILRRHKVKRSANIDEARNALESARSRHRSRHEE